MVSKGFGMVLRKVFTQCSSRGSKLHFSRNNQVSSFEGILLAKWNSQTNAIRNEEPRNVQDNITNAERHARHRGMNQSGFQVVVDVDFLVFHFHNVLHTSKDYQYHLVNITSQTPKWACLSQSVLNKVTKGRKSNNTDSKFHAVRCAGAPWLGSKANAHGT